MEYTFRNSSILKGLDIHPKHFITIKDIKIGISDPILNIKRKSDFFIGFVYLNKKIYVNTFFLSRSQGVYRCLVGYSMKNGKVRHHNKGWGETSITLPIKLQLKLFELSKNTDSLNFEDYTNMFYGASEEIYKRDYVEYHNEVEKTGSKIPIPYSGNYRVKIPPQDLNILESDYYPNFKQLKSHIEFNNRMYGNTSYYEFKSNNNLLNFLFCKNAWASWIAHLEVTNSSVTSYGLFKDWVHAGDLNTPPYEYCFINKKGKFKDQTGGYGNKENIYKSYHGMYKNYLSKVGVIKDFSTKIDLYINR
jgi:hypothetical protein